jgi:hypothetical protein
MNENKTHMTDELLPIKRSRKKPKVGDVFVIQPRESIYFYGKVIEINNIFQSIEGVNIAVILVYKQATKKLELPDYLDSNELLIPPQIVNFTGWTMGYFFTVGNMELTCEDLNLDYGFERKRSVLSYYSAIGQKLDYKPSTIGFYGLGGYGAVAYEVTKALAEHPELLEAYV